MAQFARPASDISTTGWLSTGANFYSQIDEVTPDDADYVYANAASTGTLEVKLGSVSTPGSGSVTLVVRWCDGWSGGLDPSWSGDCEISLVDNTTVLHTYYDTPPHQATYQDQYFDFTAYPPSAWNNLRIRFKKGGGGNGMYVSQAYLQVPDAGSSGSFTCIDVTLGEVEFREFDYPTLTVGPQRAEDLFLAWSDYAYTGIHRYCKALNIADAQDGFICEFSGMWAPGHKRGYDDLGRLVISDLLTGNQNGQPRFSRQ